ncbi:uncharacterized protein L201_001028 [Kwoniella dendrophila CBS 6074]|uniref:Extracellular membrane protein CFEM domain-containing protein n=1 Tax=Kwoniella dendrophila CBS 6074 TaxID=1295534 RepID=A0AAX4JL75_9TREE
MLGTSIILLLGIVAATGARCDDILHNLVQREHTLVSRANTYTTRYAESCIPICETTAMKACDSISTQADQLKCYCTYAALQTRANCVTCAKTNGGDIRVNGVTANFDTYMNAILDTCYDAGYVIPAAVYSSITQQAASKTTVYSGSAVTTTASSPPISTPASSSPSSSSSSSSSSSGSGTLYSPSGGFNSSSGFSSGSGSVCTSNFFSLINLQYSMCNHQGTVLQPKTSSTCSTSNGKTTCSWGASSPRPCGGGLLCSEIKVPSQMICDNVVRDVSTGKDIPGLQDAKIDLGDVHYYICNCNGPTDGVPPICTSCGESCKSQLNPASKLQCNVAESCIGGATWNPQSSDSNYCLKPAFAQMSSSGGVQYITDNGGTVIPCSNGNQPLDSCGNRAGSSQGSRTCNCAGTAGTFDPCGIAGGAAVKPSGSSTGTTTTNNGSPTNTSKSSGATLWQKTGSVFVRAVVALSIILAISSI